ncbi:putative inorganic polyphosphate/ATP-NAD kinase [bacterium BMS3Abin01]|nr:putative inorganic polyphosphate/ATP-NAD kinase [bacterium BMS3Abin01]HDY69514.1 NAD(+)/NADH kinase [Actinomycetota bacterium]
MIPRYEMEKYDLEDGGSAATVTEDLGDEQVDFCIAIGGDGTILRAFNRFQGLQTPVLGINFGKVGFLSAIEPGDITRDLAPFLRDQYEAQELNLLVLDAAGSRSLAINDVAVQKSDGGSVVRLGYQVDGVEMDTINCDGLVVATPAGSTAYNLSCGGPMVSLNLEALILTAIAPHTLRSRSLVLAPKEKLVIHNHSLGSAAAIYLDGRHAGDLGPGGDISVSLAAEKARLIQPPEANFFRTMRSKFIRS